MKKALFPLAFLVLVASACTDNHEVVFSRTIFSFTPGVVAGEEAWIVLRDSETGDLIDSRQLTPYIPNTFESTKKIGGGKISVTYFRAIGGQFYSEVYTNVAVGSAWTTRGYKQSDVPRDFTGRYNLEVKGTPLLESLAVSDKYGMTGDAGSTDLLSGEVKMTVFTDVSLDHQHLISTVTRTGAVKYLMLENVDADPAFDLNSAYEESNVFVMPL